MKHLVLFIALTTTAYAGQPVKPSTPSTTAMSSSTSLSHSSSMSMSGSLSNSGGNVQDVNVDPRPAAMAPGIGLTAVGSDNCLGSVSVGAGNGFWSFGGGKTVESVECNRRAYSRALASLGQTEAALQLLCLNADVAKVTPACPKPEKSVKSSEDKDEFICARTGNRC